jgi:hypothetical protein
MNIERDIIDSTDFPLGPSAENRFAERESFGQITNFEKRH